MGRRGSILQRLKVKYLFDEFWQDLCRRETFEISCMARTARKYINPPVDRKKPSTSNNSPSAARCTNSNCQQISHKSAYPTFVNHPNPPTTLKNSFYQCDSHEATKRSKFNAFTRIACLKEVIAYLEEVIASQANFAVICNFRTFKFALNNHVRNSERQQETCYAGS